MKEKRKDKPLNDGDLAVIKVVNDPVLYDKFTKRLEEERNEREDFLMRGMYLFYLIQPRSVETIQSKKGAFNKLPHLVASKNKELKKAEDGANCGGVYFICRDGEVLYVGQSSNINHRLSSHHWGFGADVFYIECEDSLERSELEDWFIKKACPIFNVRGTKSAV